MLPAPKIAGLLCPPGSYTYHNQRLTHLPAEVRTQFTAALDTIVASALEALLGAPIMAFLGEERKFRDAIQALAPDKPTVEMWDQEWEKMRRRVGMRTIQEMDADLMRILTGGEPNR
jgi:DNA replication initiation complex subunit (GINS family)